ncbi:reverse transcriptase domain-containing protein [Tanacetum coccineum]
MMNKNFVEMMRQIQMIKSVDTKCETCGGSHSFTEFPDADGYTQEAAYATTAQVGPSNELTNYMKSNEATLRVMQTHMTNMETELRNEFKSTIDARTNKIENQNNQIMNILTNMQNQNSSGSRSLPSNTVANPRGDVKAITTRSGVAYDGPTIPPTPSPLLKEVKRETEVTKDKMQNTSLGSTAYVQPPVVQDPNLKPEVAPKPKPKPSIPYPSRLNDQKLRKKVNNKMLKFLQIFQRLHFDISFANALLHMPKFASMFKSLLKLDECLALADLGASINLMPLSVWKQLSLPELTSTRMTLKLADRSVAHPKGIAEDIFVKVGMFYFPSDFVVVDYFVDPRVPLILGRPFLRTARALIDVYGEELTLRFDDDAITFKVGQTSRYFRNYKTVNQVNVIDIACEEYAQEVLGFSDSSTSGNPTPSDPIIASSSPLFTPFEGGGFILEENETFLRTPEELSNLDDDYYDTEGDILYLEKLLNEDHSLTLPPMKNDDLKQVDVTLTKLLIEEPPELELKDLPSHSEYAFLEGTDKLPIIISKELKDEEKAAILKVLKSHKRAIAWKISDIKVIKLLDAGLIYPVFDSPWVSPVHCMPKKGGMTVVEKEDNELIPTRIEVDRAKVDVIAKLPHPTSVKGAVLGQRKTKHFQPIHYASKTMTDAQAHYITMEKELLAVVYAFEKFQPYLVLSKTIVYTDHSALKYLLPKQDAKPRLLRWLLLLQEFDVIIQDKKGAENLMADHLS